MSKVNKWMPFYVSDYLEDTEELSLAEHGAYSLLLCHSWASGPVSADPERIARKLRCSVKEWLKVAPAVLPFFTVVDGKLIQKRLEAERAKAIGIMEERAKAGKAGADKRWPKPDENVPNGAENDPGDNNPIVSASDKPIANAMANAIDEPLAKTQESHRQNDPTLNLKLPKNLSEKGRESLPSEARPPDDLLLAVSAWNAMAARLGLPLVQKLTEPRKRRLRLRLVECDGLEGWSVALLNVERSAFLCGENGRWAADFDFVIQATSFQKLIEGGFADRHKPEVEGYFDRQVREDREREAAAAARSEHRVLHS